MGQIAEWLAQFKTATILPAVVGGAIAILLEKSRHTWGTALIALLSGVFVAYVATDSIVEYLGWEGNASSTVAAVLGITGRNLIMWILVASRDPLKAWKNRK